MNQYLFNILRRILPLAAKEVYYINGQQTLPQPLSQEEEGELIAHMESESARSELVERNLRLVVYIAKKFENTGVNIEDLISIGTIGLMKAISSFCPEKNIKLATYASRCIENEILMFMRKNNARRPELSIDEPLNVDRDGNELLLSDVLASDDDALFSRIEHEEDRRTIHAALSELGSRERQIITLRFGLDGTRERTQKEVADLLGISQSYISRLEKKIILLLRKDIGAKI